MALVPAVFDGCAGSKPMVRSPAPSIVGTWRSDCFSANADQGATTTYVIRETTWQIDYVLFDDRECTSSFFTIHIEGAYAMEAPSAAAPGAFAATFQFASKTITPHVEHAAMFLGSPDGCDRREFVVGHTTEVSSSGCPGLFLRPIAVCEADFDLVQVSGDELRFGARPDDNDMCSEARRPTSLEPIANRRR